MGWNNAKVEEEEGKIGVNFLSQGKKPRCNRDSNHRPFDRMAACLSIRPPRPPYYYLGLKHSLIMTQLQGLRLPPFSGHLSDFFPDCPVDSPSKWTKVRSFFHRIGHCPVRILKARTADSSLSLFPHHKGRDRHTSAEAQTTFVSNGLGASFLRNTPTSLYIRSAREHASSTAAALHDCTAYNNLFAFTAAEIFARSLMSQGFLFLNKWVGICSWKNVR